VNNLICIENFSDFPQLGRFTLRTEGKLLMVGRIFSWEADTQTIYFHFLSGFHGRCKLLPSK
jgi:hypothetical protein